MKRFRVSFADAALRDVQQIWQFTFEKSGLANANSFRARIMQDCTSLEFAPHRGVQRNLGGTPVRAIGVGGGRVTLIFRVKQDVVELLRLHYAGVDHQYR